jgi:hypothetical protein
LHGGFNAQIVNHGIAAERYSRAESAKGACDIVSRLDWAERNAQKAPQTGARINLVKI